MKKFICLILTVIFAVVMFLSISAKSPPFASSEKGLQSNEKMSPLKTSRAASETIVIQALDSEESFAATKAIKYRTGVRYKITQYTLSKYFKPAICYRFKADFSLD